MLMLSITPHSSALSTRSPDPRYLILIVLSPRAATGNDITKVVKRRLADGAAASLGLRDGNNRGHDGDRPIVNVSGLASSTWCPACSSCITGGELRLSIRTCQPVINISPRSSSPPEHIAHASDVPRCIPARPQLVWCVACKTLRRVPLPSVSSGFALGAPLGSVSAPGLSGHLRAALRTRLSQHFARFGRRSERQRALDDACVCRSCGDAAPRALECIHGRVLCYDGALRLARLVTTINTTTWDAWEQCREPVPYFFLPFRKILAKQPNV